MNAIEIRNITKRYPDFSLDCPHFDLPEGTVMGLVGENGAGKSTLIRLIMNTTCRDSGQIAVLGIDNDEPTFHDLKNDIGIVLDSAYFPETLNATKVGTMMQLTYDRWDADCYRTFLNTFKLPAKKVFKAYSRGMKMKLAIAVALSHHPRLLVLDEPTGGLDPMIREEILNVFNEFTRDPQHSILISSHIVSDLEKICDYITVLHEGRLVLSLSKDELLDRFAIIRCSETDYETIPPAAIHYQENSAYGYKLLVENHQVHPALVREHVALEDVIILLNKGGYSHESTTL